MDSWSKDTDIQECLNKVFTGSLHDSSCCVRPPSVCTCPPLWAVTGEPLPLCSYFTRNNYVPNTYNLAYVSDIYLNSSYVCAVVIARIFASLRIQYNLSACTASCNSWCNSAISLKLSIFRDILTIYFLFVAIATKQVRNWFMNDFLHYDDLIIISIWNNAVLYVIHLTLT